MTDASGTSSYTYTNTLLSSTTNGAGAVTSYTYDDSARAASVSYPDKRVVTRSYDTDGRLSTVTDWAKKTTTFSYDGDSNPTGISYPGGVKTTSTVNAADQVTGISTSSPSGTAVFG